MMQELKIGLVGLDTSHVTTFTSLLNDPRHDFHIPGARVVAAFPGGSPDFERSRSRVEGFTASLRDEWGVQILDSPGAVAQACDAIMLTAVDGRAHLPLFTEIAPHGKPTFIDKPFTTTSSDAREIIDLAAKNRVPVMSSSSLRYAQPLVDALCNDGAVVGADCFGPMNIEPTQPGYFWYGIHSIEMLYAAFGPGCESVSVASNENFDVITARWRDGRLGTVRGNRCGNHSFGITLHRASDSQYLTPYVHPKPAYAGLLENALLMFRGTGTPVDINEALEVVRFIEAANKSRESGETVAI